jgi:outer membrane protein assembly factor BamA
MYLEEELVYDSRRPSSPYATQTIDAAGWLARSHVGVARGIDTDTTHYLSYGGELQKFFDLYDGTRSLGLRGMVEAVAGTDGRTDGKISFVDLPRLGGSEILRGYPSGRFRDRIVWVATAEYTWEVLAQASAYAFFDAGQPLESYGDAPAEKLRFGYGAGLQLHTKHTFMMRSQIAFSREGDVLLNLVFSPAFGRQERAGRY